MSGQSGDICGLGYVGVVARALDDWERFGARLLGLQAVRSSRGEIAFRMDGAARRLMVHEGGRDRPAYFGWEVKNALALEALAARLERAHVAVERLTPGMCEQRGVAAALACADPCGARLEFFYGQARTDAPFQPGRPISGFRTGALGMGHVVLNVDQAELVLPFYLNVLGFQLTDFALRPFKAYFLHTNARHHSLALIENSQKGLHHIMLEVEGIDDMGQAYDLALLDEGRIATTLGRHSNDHMTSFYVRSPSGFLVEYGWGGRDIDPATWQAVELHSGPSLWGHERDWLPEEVRAQARRMRLEAAARGERAPLRVRNDL